MLKKFSFIILLALGIAFPSASMGATPRHTLASAIDRALEANPTMEEKIHTYLQLLDYIYQSNEIEKERRESASNEKADSDIRQTINRQER